MSPTRHTSKGLKRVTCWIARVMLDMLRISRGPNRAPGRAVTPPSSGTPASTISSSLIFVQYGTRMKVGMPLKRGNAIWLRSVPGMMFSSEGRRSIGPQHACNGLARVAITVRNSAGEIEGVTRMQQITFIAQGQFELTFDHITQFFPGVADLLVAACKRFDHVNIALQQLSRSRDDHPFEHDRKALAGRRKLGRGALVRALHGRGIDVRSRDERTHVGRQRQRDLVQRRERGLRVAALEFGQHAFRATCFRCERFERQLLHHSRVFQTHAECSGRVELDLGRLAYGSVRVRRFAYCRFFRGHRKALPKSRGIYASTVNSTSSGFNALIGIISCGHADMTTTQSMSALIST